MWISSAACWKTPRSNLHQKSRIPFSAVRLFAFVQQSAVLVDAGKGRDIFGILFYFWTDGLNPRRFHDALNRAEIYDKVEKDQFKTVVADLL